MVLIEELGWPEWPNPFTPVSWAQARDMLPRSCGVLARDHRPTGALDGTAQRSLAHGRRAVWDAPVTPALPTGAATSLTRVPTVPRPPSARCPAPGASTHRPAGTRAARVARAGCYHLVTRSANLGAPGVPAVRSPFHGWVRAEEGEERRRGARARAGAGDAAVRGSARDGYAQDVAEGAEAATGRQHGTGVGLGLWGPRG